MFGLIRNCCLHLYGVRVRQAVIAVLGLDNAGKTTLLQSLQQGAVRPTKPTVGFKAEKLAFGSVRATFFDIGGSKSIRKIWKHYFSESEGIIFVIDSSDAPRLSEARDALHELLLDMELAEKPFVIFVNKQDLPGALPIHEVVNMLVLPTTEDFRVLLVPCEARRQNATSAVDERLFTGIRWLLKNIGKDPSLTCDKVLCRAKTYKTRLVDRRGHVSTETSRLAKSSFGQISEHENAAQNDASAAGELQLASALPIQDANKLTTHVDISALHNSPELSMKQVPSETLPALPCVQQGSEVRPMNDILPANPLFRPIPVSV
eukprot:CAMPEP_0183789010 /NCGR_PEP_ID=MMETSP0803_2-20130417/150_1 /TAXON_ID=195967 /ORGANISM="Crustomastix stigmata, Strain CCMP3273" /LENGTH=318 /DNA_ID=CAMNT_0026033165 /DNA_START=105 /DNA_END=1061 /DNA_ORIENTATION=+